MDIDIADVRQAIEAGEIAAGNKTTHHPVIAAGMSRWIDTVGVLRGRLARGPWVSSDPRNRPVSNHRELPYGLSTVGATEPTGIADHPSGPRAARRKGIGTAEAVNLTIPWITVETLRQQEPVVDIGGPPSGNWFLLYYRDTDGVRAEISLPRGFEGGQFTGWIVRVILPEWQSPDGVKTRKPLDVGGQDVDFQVSEVAS
ncbi:hypothetical protein BST10_18800 [Mycolicibacter algericus DSM 45454]|nr:hypothetical protein BST10_18800 [Mycolicibacter algericus DSM 45454]